MDSDALLIRRAKAGEALAFERLARRYAGLLEAAAAKYFLPDGGRDDLRQEALIGFHKAVGDYRSEAGSFAAFARLCVQRNVITAVQTATRAKHRPLNESASLSQPVGDSDDLELGDTLANAEREVADVLDDRDEAGALLRALQGRGLTHVERVAITGTLLEDRSYGEIAAVCDVGVKTIDNALQRGRRKLAALAKAELAKGPQSIRRPKLVVPSTSVPQIDGRTAEGKRLRRTRTRLAGELRRRGFSYAQVAKHLGIAVPTAISYVEESVPHLRLVSEITRRGGRPKGSGTMLSDDRLRELHRLYVNEALSVNEVARRIVPSDGFASVDSASVSLTRGWSRLGLRLNGTVGNRCTARKTQNPNRGSRCSRPALVGARRCWLHADPDRAATHAAQMREAVAA